MQKVLAKYVLTKSSSLVYNIASILEDRLTRLSLRDSIIRKLTCFSVDFCCCIIPAALSQVEKT